MKSYDATVVVPVNFVIFTLSAILAGEFVLVLAIDSFLFCNA